VGVIANGEVLAGERSAGNGEEGIVLGDGEE